jgi:hypothetical protein
LFYFEARSFYVKLCKMDEKYCGGHHFLPAVIVHPAWVPSPILDQAQGIKMTGGPKETQRKSQPRNFR